MTLQTDDARGGGGCWGVLLGRRVYSVACIGRQQPLPQRVEHRLHLLRRLVLLAALCVAPSGAAEHAASIRGEL